MDLKAFFKEEGNHLKYQVSIYLYTSYFEVNQLLNGYLSYLMNQQVQIELY